MDRPMGSKEVAVPGGVHIDRAPWPTRPAATAEAQSLVNVEFGGPHTEREARVDALVESTKKKAVVIGTPPAIRNATFPYD